MHRDPKRLKILGFLAHESLSVGEFNVLEMTHYASLPPVTMIRMAHAESIGWRAWPASSRRACRDGVASLMARGLLQIIDDAALGRIKAEMAAEPALGPIDGLPEFGDLDFTKAGGTLWGRIDREVFDRDPAEYWMGKGECDSMEYYAASESTLRRLLDEDGRFSGREVLSMGDIIAIGPWRDRWWNDIFDRGFRAILHYRPEPEDA